MRPVRELKGFQKISLKPGEEKIHDWYVQSGNFVIEIGSSSRDIRLKESIEIEGTVELPVVYTENSTIKDLTKTKRGQEFLN